MDSAAKPREELAAVFQKHRDSLFNMIARLIGNCDEAHDVLQETFLRAVRGWERFRGQAEPRTWLYRIAVNCSYNHRKKAQNRPRTVDPEVILAVPAETVEGERTLLQQERRRLIETALQSLKPAMRTLVVLRDVEGLSYAEIAAVLGCSAGTVASRLSRARHLLGRKLKELGVV